MEDKVKIVGEPELYDIRGKELRLGINGLLGEVKSTLKRGSWMLNSA